MAISLGNRAKMSTSTTGTGTISLGSALSGYQSFENAGITNGQTIRYAIEDGTAFEIGSGTYTSSGTTLTRSVTESSNSDNAITLSGNAEVFVTATVADLFINDGASTLTTTGVITGGTVEATSDTAAGDNAAMGYQSDDGLVLTGQGAVRDVTIKNDADATVISIPTGTTNVDFASSIDVANVGIATGVIDLKNGGSQSVVKFYCEDNNAHYAQIQAPAHGAFSGNVTLTLPATTDTIAGIAATQTFTNKTLTTPVLTTPIANAGIQLKNGSTSAGFLEFFEDSDNGTNKVTLIGPASTADVTITLPAAADTLVGKATTDTLTNKTLTTPVVNAGAQLKNGATSAGFLQFFEDSDNGTNKVTLIGPASTADITLTLPSTAGTLATTAVVTSTATTVAQDEATALAIALG
jgi:preprotein translocase subunit Sec61beta